MLPLLWSWGAQMLNAVYAYYTVPAKHTLEQLFGDMLILAKKVQYVDEKKILALCWMGCAES